MTRLLVLHAGEPTESVGYWIEPVPKPQTIEDYEKLWRRYLVGDLAPVGEGGSLKSSGIA